MKKIRTIIAVPFIVLGAILFGVGLAIGSGLAAATDLMDRMGKAI